MLFTLDTRDCVFCFWCAYEYTCCIIISLLYVHFCIVFGSDKLSKETKDAMLYGQLQEGIWLSIIKSPGVSGALTYKTYKELCMAAKHEEKRLVEVRKCQESERLNATKDN